jgi:hypothetical protein
MFIALIPVLLAAFLGTAFAAVYQDVQELPTTAFDFVIIGGTLDLIGV